MKSLFLILIAISTLQSIKSNCFQPHRTNGYLAWNCIDEFTDTPFEYVDEANDYGKFYNQGNLNVEELVYEIYLSKKYYTPLHDAIVRAGKKNEKEGYKQDLGIGEL